MKCECREVLAIIGSGEGDLREAKILELFKKVRTLIAHGVYRISYSINEQSVRIKRFREELVM